MISKLRKRFIIVAMISMLLVLSAIITGIGVFNYYDMVSESDSVLASLQENNGVFPSFMEGDRLPGLGKGYRSKEFPFEARYFSAVIDPDGNIVSSDMDRIYAVTDSTISGYVDQVMAQQSDKGFAGQYRYLRYTADDGTHILFQDCGRRMAINADTLKNIIITSLVGFAVVLALILFFSGLVFRPVKESYEKQKMFISDAGHELKTPITIIDADIENEQLEHGRSEWTDDVKKQTVRLKGLTNDLIYLSRMEEARKPVMAEAPLSELVEEALSSFHARSVMTGHPISEHIQPMLSLVCDPEAITRLVNILMDNAMKYASDEGMISVSLEKQGRHCVLKVTNPAENITDETLHSMFDRFYRADASRNNRTPGYGLGLSIAKAIVLQHGGRIEASRSGEGLIIMTVQLG